MAAIFGLVVVVLAVFGGYTLEHGDLGLLLQPAEFLIIWGAAIGSMVIATPIPVLRRVFSGAWKAVRAMMASTAAPALTASPAVLVMTN